MPQIQWTNLPAELRDHLFERARERQISTEDLYQLKLWRESSPEAPEGRWYGAGIRSLDHSRSAARADTSKHFFFVVNMLRGKRSFRTSTHV